jgi:polyphosphate kinase
LRPGIPELSENIHIRSVVGRFLEHSRVYYFLNNGKEEFYCASADWMDRNFFRRNESCFPIRQKPLKERLRSDLDLFLMDNTQSWILRGDGSYVQQRPQGEPPVSAQESFLRQMATTSQENPSDSQIEFSAHRRQTKTQA